MVKRAKKKAPRVDYLQAVFLQRKKAMNYTTGDLSEIAGYSYSIAKQHFQKSPKEWPQDFRWAIFDILQIDDNLQMLCEVLDKKNVRVTFNTADDTAVISA